MGRGWLAVEKPAGLSVHNDPGRDLCSLAANLQDRPDWWDPVFGLHPVHRLDRETSGVILLAGTKETLAYLGDQFQRRAVEKSYYAIVHGHPASPDGGAPHAWGRWDWPLTSKATGRKNIQGAGIRQPAGTRYRVLERTGHYSLMQLCPETGRRHQLRRHAALAGRPVVGDRRYGSMRAIRFLARHSGFSRLALHAHCLTLCVPGESRPLTILSTGLPQDLRHLLALDRQASEPV